MMMSFGRCSGITSVIVDRKCLSPRIAHLVLDRSLSAASFIERSSTKRALVGEIHRHTTAKHAIACMDKLTEVTDVHVNL